MHITEKDLLDIKAGENEPQSADNSEIPPNKQRASLLCQIHQFVDILKQFQKSQDRIVFLFVRDQSSTADAIDVDQETLKAKYIAGTVLEEVTNLSIVSLQNIN